MAFPTLVPVAEWYNILTRMLHETRAEMRNVDLTYNPSVLPEIAIGEGTVQNLTDGEPADRTLLFEAVIDVFARIMLVLARDLAPPDTEPLPREQQAVFDRLSFRLSGSLEAVVLMRRWGSGIFSVRLFALEHTPHAEVPYRMCMAERRDVNFVLTLVHSDAGRGRDFMRFTPVQLFVEALHRHVRGEENFTRVVRWGETALVGTLLEAITSARTVANDVSLFDRAIAPVIRAVLLGSNISAFLARVAPTAAYIAQGLQRARTDDETIAVIAQLRGLVDRLAVRGGVPRNLPVGMTRDQLYNLITAVAVGLHRTGLGARPLERSRYGNDPVDYTRVQYVENPGEENYEAQRNGSADTNGSDSESSNGSSSTNGFSFTSALVAPYTEIGKDGSRLMHL